jgi:hypothetical protein
MHAHDPMEEARAQQRSQWPVRKGKLSEMEGDEADLSATSTVAQRFAWMWQLAQDGWTFRGKPIDESTLPRHTGRLVRRGS